jgi:apolipoprotein N-acyltransferase
MTTLKEVGLACLSGLLLIPAFPTFDYDWLAWIFLIPLLAALKGRGPAWSFFLAYLAGLIFFEGIFGPIAAQTVHSLKPIHFIISSTYFALYWGLWGIGFSLLNRRMVFPPTLVLGALWVTLEYARSHASIFAYPGLLLGHTTYHHIPLIQLASLSGVYGLSFVLVCVNAGLFYGLHAVKEREWSHAVSALAPAVSVVAATTVMGLSALEKQPSTRQITVAIVQPNILPHEKWGSFDQERILHTNARLTHEATSQSPTLIIWPESAIPGDILHSAGLRHTVGRIAKDSHAFLLVGSSEYAKFSTADRSSGDYYNSMVLFSPSGDVTGVYRKQKLVPFAEYVPLDRWVTWPQFIGSALGRALPGQEWQLFDVNGVRVATVICWETLFPEFFREFVGRGAQMMVAATDESWFGNASEPHQLLAITVFRAVENHVAIARAANSGLSSFIDPDGRIIATVQGEDNRDLFIQGVLNASLPISRDRTFYTQHGDVFAAVMIGLTMIAIMYAASPRRCRSEAFARIPGLRLRQRDGGRI